MAKDLIDPIKSYEDIKEHFILYLKTAFGTRFRDTIYDGENKKESFEDERTKLLESDKVFTREPWIEPLPSYKTSKRVSSLTEDDLPGMDKKAIGLFKNFITRGLINDKFPLYEHQLTMLTSALRGNDCVITSGTGSGKTESFLLPLFADLIKEAENWPVKTDQTSYKKNDWWNTTPMGQTRLFSYSQGSNIGHLSNVASQRPNETRPAALRALIIYPMNALVEDQMTRLREALDSDKVQKFMDEEMGGNRFFFGRYNSTTPVAGMPVKGKTDNNRSIYEKLKASMIDLERRTQEVMEMDAQSKTPSLSEEERKEFAHKYKVRRSIDSVLYGKEERVSSEMRSRFDMQQTPPDILITNYSMLATMLMRKVESPMLEQTRKWLEEDPDKEHPTRIFHLIIDELHLNRGTTGTEIAYLIKLFLNRLGLSPESKQLRILSSSASLDINGNEEEQSLKYLKDFFGRNFTRDNVIEGHYKEIDEVYTGKLPTAPFCEIQRLFKSKGIDCLEKDDKAAEVDSALSQIAHELKAVFGCNDAQWQDEAGRFQLLGVMNSKGLGMSKRLVDAFDCGDMGKFRPIPLTRHDNDNNALDKYLDSSLFDGSTQEIRDATEGLIIVRGIFDTVSNIKDENGNTKYATELPRFRFHMFFRNIPGLWATIDKCDWKHNRPVGTLHPDPIDIDEDAGGRRVLEVLYCSSCGSVFYGGKRFKYMEGNEDVIEMLPSSSNIEELPEKESQLIVENKTYSDYVIFYPIDPIGFDERSMETPSLRDDKDIKMEHKMADGTEYPCRWQMATLNVYTGRITPVDTWGDITDAPQNEIGGYLYVVDELDNDDDKAKMAPALPTHCPFCGEERIKSPARPSAIRGFRTGFGKATQVFTKELFYQLPTRNKAKLVAFSDSREDAARVSNDIEREQYTDILRDIFIETLDNHHAESRGEIAELEEKITSLKKVVSLAPDETTKQVLLTSIESLQQKLIAAKSPYIRFHDIINRDNFFESNLFNSFKKLGVNPAGVDWEVQNVFIDNQHETKPWYRITRDSPTEASKLIENSLGKIHEEILKVLFGRLYFGIESAGIGIVTVKPDRNLAQQCLAGQGITGKVPVDEFMQIVASSIRILGEKYQYENNPFGYIRTPGRSYEKLNSRHQLRFYLKKCCDKYGIPHEDNGHKGTNALAEAVQKYLEAPGHGQTCLFLNPDQFYIKETKADDNAYVCSHCKKVHLHLSGGVCCNCGTRLDANCAVKVSEIRSHNYIMLNESIGRKPCKLHSEELTGQTDNPKARQNEFRDIIKAGEDATDKKLEELVKSIDVLSVTTTLEVGVDIGPLQGVLLANMPPQRFNYQQRVGRGGRRGQAFSLVLTLCRGRSHDNYYFNNPYKITGDRPPVPFLSLDQIDIAKRLFAKEILYHAFKSYSVEHSVILDGNTHGEFGKRNDWDSLYKDYIKNWLKNNHAIIHDNAELLQPSNAQELEAWAEDVQSDTGLFKKMDRALDNTPYIVAEYIAECLAEAGILPMYGMPTRDRTLYTGFQKDNLGGIDDELSTTDRDIDQAITSFAPGHSITKDKKMKVVVGFAQPSLFVDHINGHYSIKTRSRHIIDNGTNTTALVNTGNIITQDANGNFYVEPSVFPLDMVMIKCKNKGCSHFSVISPTEYENNKPQYATCPDCGSPLEAVRLRTPAAFITDLTPGENKLENNGTSIRHNTVNAESNDNPANHKDKSYQNAYFSLGKEDYTWRINDNEIKGTTREITYCTPFSGNIRSYAKQWISDTFYVDNRKTVRSHDEPEVIDRGNGYRTSFWASDHEDETMKLASRKVTNVFRLTFLHPQNVTGIQLNPLLAEDDGHGGTRLCFASQGIRSAYYSLSFILQRAIASELDVDPEEIDVAEPQLTEVGGVKCGEITLADELVNGSGFVEDLFMNFGKYIANILDGKDSFFQYMLSPEHQQECKTSCYRCLQVYRNMPYHGLLDWRLGISLFRLMVDPDYKVGQDGDFNDYPELNGWMDMASEQLSNLNKGFFNSKCQQGNNVLPWLCAPNGKYIVAVHPLWTADRHNQALAAACHQLGQDTTSVIPIDTFNLIRRPGKCFEHIMEKL